MLHYIIFSVFLGFEIWSSDTNNHPSTFLAIMPNLPCLNAYKRQY
ncbi:hypothetical protein AO377_0134 [Moraxella catarrhalis]|nr:hypothetical protein AO377_0134 [Moraxella catarrhalis]OAV14319.1 hypothetical protein AO375_1161 [Moraxella catarrhalis]OAV23914.1 hypothetical protein AO369_2025 [Moraxella catarrhalis]OAV36101.1 hypothetical protein AO365_0987 [Moraxella catarrhalis]